MAERVRKQKPKAEKKAEAKVDPAPQESRDEQLSEIDAVLDEIDEVLEVNAEEFVRGYIQKGGQ